MVNRKVNVPTLVASNIESMVMLAEWLSARSYKNEGRGFFRDCVCSSVLND